MFMILFVLDASDRCDEILDAWDQAGVSGVTILLSTGLGRVKQKAALRDDFPLIPSLEEFFAHEENQNRTLMTIVPDQTTVDRVVAVTQSIIGDLNNPNTGILAVLPVMQAYGLNRKETN